MSNSIIALSAENFKRIKAINITPSGALVQITGKNGNGKSSVLDSIEAVLGGEKNICDKPVRRGEKKAKVVIDLGDFIATRTFSDTGHTALTVTNKDGAKYPSPQAMLDKLMNRLGFDPLAFSRMEGKKQLETLRQLVGLDFTEADAKRKLLYDQRTGINQQVSILQGQLAAAPLHDDAPKEEVSIIDLSNELDRRRKVNAENSNRNLQMAKMAEKIRDHGEAMQLAKTAEEKATEFLKTSIEQLDKRLEADIKRLREDHKRNVEAQRSASGREIKHCQDEWATVQEARRDLEAELKRLQETAKDAKDEDVTEIQTKMAEADGLNRKVRANADRKKIAEAVDKAKDAAGKLTAQIEAIDDEKARTLEKASFPVEGLSFDENGVLYNGIPFDQASSAERLRVSVAMGLAMNKTLRVMLIRDGSLLDSENLKMIADMAEKNDSQVWIERATDGQPIGIVIEDGSVKSEPSDELFEKKEK